MNKLYIELSSKCNLNCKMCFRNLWFDEKCELMTDTTVEEIKENIVSGQFQTVFFGGESFLVMGIDFFHINSLL